MGKVEIDYGFEGSRKAWTEYQAQQRRERRDLVCLLLILVAVGVITFFHFFILPTLIPNIK